MKINKFFRLSAAALAVTLLAPQFGLIARAAAPTPTTDEAVYVNLDEYGLLTDMRVVKGVYLNGVTSLSDYGDYSAVYNMTSHDKPQMRDDGVDFTLEHVDGSRFYYECIPNDPASLQMPWTFDVSYKLDGVPAAAGDLAGASGLVEINIHAVPNPNADEYYRNNMILLLGTGIDMDDTKSLEAPGAQIQSMGSYKFAVFIGLPGEEDTYTVRIGADSFESMGIYMMMAPATMSQLDKISDLRDARDTLKDTHDDLYSGLSDMLDAMSGMQGGIQSMADGISGINEVRKQLIASRGTLDPDLDAALDALEVLAGDSEALIPELDTAQKDLNDLYDNTTDMLTTLTDSKADIKDYQELLKGLKRNLSSMEDMLDDIDNVAGLDELDDMRDALKSLRGDCDDLSDALGDMSDALGELRRIEDVLEEILGILDSLPEEIPTDQTEQAVRALLNWLNDVSGACEDSSDALRGTLDSMNELLKCTESALDQLEDLNDVLEDYKGLGQDTAALGQEATALMSKTLDSMDTLLTQTESLQTTMTESNADANVLIPKLKSAVSSLTEALKSANTLLGDTRDTLRSLRDQSDASMQQSLDGLIDVMQRAADTGDTTKSLQSANDSMYNTIKDEMDDLEDDNNMLEMDNSLALRSFTSDKNASPSSLQFILRTSEISVDEAAEVQAEEAAEKDIGVWGRIVNIFKKLFSAVTEAFS